MWFKLDLNRSAVMILVSAMPLMGLAGQTLPLKSTQEAIRAQQGNPLSDKSLQGRASAVLDQKAFEMGAQWKIRLESRGLKGDVLKTGGGGGVDGGGGNLSQGAIFDNYQNSELEKVRAGSLSEIVQLQYADRLKQIQQAHPGFINWLYSGFQVDWYADAKPFAESFCHNESIYKVSQQVVACQTWTSIKFQRSWILSPMPTQQSYMQDLITGSSDEGMVADENSAGIIVHELVRYHILRLGKERGLNQLEQDDLVAKVTWNILNPQTSPDDVMALLVQSGLVPDPREAEGQRRQDLTTLQQRMAEAMASASAIVQGCQSQGLEMNGFDFAIKNYQQYGRQCLSLAMEQDEQGLCDTERNVQILKSRHQQYCQKAR